MASLSLVHPVVGHLTLRRKADPCTFGTTGCPDYLTLISKRAKAHKLPVGPPYVPESLLNLIQRVDPAAAPYTAPDSSNPFLGKKVLILAGKDDKTVPWSAGKAFVENLNVGQDGVKEVIIEEGVGHEFSPAMVKEVARFVWQHALVQQL